MDIGNWRKTKLKDQLDKFEEFHENFKDTSQFFKKTM